MPKINRRRLPLTLMRFWLLYAVLVIVLLAVIGVPLYCGFYGVLSRETYNSTADVLKTMSRTMDTHLRDMDRIAVQLSQNTKLIPYFLEQTGMYAYEAQQELDKVRRSNEFIYDVAVYFTPETMLNKAGRIYAASGEYSPDLYFDYIYRYESWNATLFRQQIPQTVRPAVRPMETIWVHRCYPDRFVTYICPLIGNMQTNSRGVVMFMINKSKMEALIGSTLAGYDGLACISDAAGNPVFVADHTSAGVSPADLSSARAQALAEPSPIRDAAINGSEFAQITVQSGYNGWSYLCLLPKSMLLQKVYADLTLILYTLAVALVLGIVIAYLLSVKSYTPIRQLSNKLARFSDTAGRNRGDDLAMIACTVDNLVQNNATLLSRLSSQQSMVRMQVLQNLLFSQFDTIQGIKKLMDASDIDFPYGDFCVMVFSIRNHQEFSAAHDHSIQELLRFGMLNAMEELAQRNCCRGYGVDLPGENATALLLNLNAGSAVLESIGGEMTEFFEKNFRISLTVGVGCRCGAISGVPASFRQAMAAVSERFVLGHERIITYRTCTQGGQWRPVEEERRILDAVRQGNSLAAENAAAGIVGGILQRGLGAAAARAILSAAANAVNKLLCDMRLCQDLDLEPVLACRQDTIWQWQADMVEALGKACRHVARIKDSNKTRLKEQLLEYVNANYASSDISLQSLADLFNLSMGHITRFFKEQTGISLMHYLDQVRMSHAKQMLGDTLLPLGDIMHRCGYVDETNFIRKFKGMYGQTPIQYRRSVQLQRRLEAGAEAGLGSRT